MKPKGSSNKPSKGPGRVLSDNACPNCGSSMVRRSSTLKLPIHGEEVAVPHVSHLHCTDCDERVLDIGQSRDLHRRALDSYRERHGLLTADDIRLIREKYGLSQLGLAMLLKLGAVTLSRWESGRFVQSSSMDVLLRLIRDVPDTIEYLRKRAA